ncbi:MAG: hypothetical protein HYY62_01915 [Deltaproteobacteria bacterium]|nr:hypothetical protein [Deltaproteobacteria bacterium]
MIALKGIRSHEHISFSMSKTFISLLLLTCWLWTTTATAFLLPAKTVLQNNVSSRKFLKEVQLSQTLHFLEGFYSPKAFDCEEKISISALLNMSRFDYVCQDVSYTLLRTAKANKVIYNKTIETKPSVPLNAWPALFFATDFPSLIQSLSHNEFISAEEKEEEEAASDPRLRGDDKGSKEKDWNIEGTISLVRLGKIEKATPQKLEKNVVLLLTAPSGSQKIWFEKDLFLPQKMEIGGRTFVFQNYREIPILPLKKTFFRYPQKIEIQEGEVPGITIESDSTKTLVNPKFSKDIFDAQKISKINTTSVSEETSYMKEVLEKFILEYR